MKREAEPHGAGYRDGPRAAPAEPHARARTLRRFLLAPAVLGATLLALCVARQQRDLALFVLLFIALPLALVTLAAGEVAFRGDRRRWRARRPGEPALPYWRFALRYQLAMLGFAQVLLVGGGVFAARGGFGGDYPETGWRPGLHTYLALLALYAVVIALPLLAVAFVAWRAERRARSDPQHAGPHGDGVSELSN